MVQRKRNMSGWFQYKRRTNDVISQFVSKENKHHKYELQGHLSTKCLVNWPKDSQKYDLYISEEGIYEIVLKSKQPQSTLLAENLGINIYKHKYISKENDSVEIIMKTFDGEEMIRQFHIGKYRIDLYFPEYRLAVECDEFGHADRDIDYEVKRQRFIEDQLKCQFIRYNPDDHGFEILVVLNKIFRKIKVQNE